MRVTGRLSIDWSNPVEVDGYIVVGGRSIKVATIVVDAERRRVSVTAGTAIHHKMTKGAARRIVKVLGRAVWHYGIAGTRDWRALLRQLQRASRDAGLKELARAARHCAISG